MTEFDYTIIGAGMAGLYCALLLSLKYPGKKILILEKNDYIGGRVLVEKFCGKDVVIGAGVGRYGKDRNLQALLERYNIPVTPYLGKKDHIGFEPVDVYKMAKDMEKKKLDLTKTFKQNFIHLYGNELWNRFELTTGYTDYADADVLDTLKHYGFEEYRPGMKYFSVNWNLLKEKMVEELKENGVVIHKNIDVKSVKKVGTDHVVIETHKSSAGSKKAFDTKTVIFATNLPGLKSYINPKYEKYITSQIVCQPFMRMYVKVGDEIDSIKHYTVVNNFLQKIIPMGDKIYMMSYSDNKYATDLNKMNIDVIRKKLEDLFDVNVCKIAKYYWPCGTHYYKPLKYFKDREEFLNIAQHPEENVFMVGDTVAFDQGWVEGALDSVRRLI